MDPLLFMNAECRSYNNSVDVVIRHEYCIIVIIKDFLVKLTIYTVTLL